MIKFILVLFCLTIGFIYCIIYLGEKAHKDELEKVENGTKVALSYIGVYLIGITLLVVSFKDAGLTLYDLLVELMGGSLMVFFTGLLTLLCIVFFIWIIVVIIQIVTGMRIRDMIRR